MADGTLAPMSLAVLFQVRRAILPLIAFDPQVLLDEHASLAALMLFLGLLSLLAASFVAQHSVQILDNTTTNETAKFAAFADVCTADATLQGPHQPSLQSWMAGQHCRGAEAACLRLPNSIEPMLTESSANGVAAIHCMDTH